MDINISANTLFHFTPTKRSLMAILSNGLYVRYCLENYESLVSGEAELVLPMTCFCDIPLSQVKRHSSTYGTYAIGLTKSWGMKNGVNPVIYTYPNSTTSMLLDQIVDDIENFFDVKEEEVPRRNSKEILKPLQDDSLLYFDKIVELRRNLGHFIKFIKPYEGKFYRGNDYLEKPVRFYEEREWRFVPPMDLFVKSVLKDSYKGEYYKDLVKRRAINIKLASHLKLNFDPSDIRFIIVEKESEIPDLLSEMEDVFGSRSTLNEFKLLSTRLISLEQILEDL